tara:strand:+ start:1341 stop:1583 length:243 start_codon:yes stop_codon:yes gene_type:complete
MLFHFKTAQKIPIWMKNTIIPLDIIWLNTEFEIVDLYPNTEPFSHKILFPQKKGNYVLEVNSGTIKLYNLTKGQKIKPYF